MSDIEIGDEIKPAEDDVAQRIARKLYEGNWLDVFEDEVANVAYIIRSMLEAQ